MSLLGKIVVITGASQGIGASCARLFTARGARLSLTAMPDPAFPETDTDKLVITAGDITSAGTRQRVVERILSRFGRIDVLVNNAGVGQYGAPSAVDTEISKRLFDINVFSALALRLEVGPPLHRRFPAPGTEE